MKEIPKLAILLLLIFPGCITPIKVQHTVEPIKIEITVRIQVEKDLDDFFGDIDNTPALTDDTNGGTGL